MRGNLIQIGGEGDKSAFSKIFNEFLQSKLQTNTPEYNRVKEAVAYLKMCLQHRSDQQINEYLEHFFGDQEDTIHRVKSARRAGLIIKCERTAEGIDVYVTPTAKFEGKEFSKIRLALDCDADVMAPIANTGLGGTFTIQLEGYDFILTVFPVYTSREELEEMAHEVGGKATTFNFIEIGPGYAQQLVNPLYGRIKAALMENEDFEKKSIENICEAITAKCFSDLPKEAQPFIHQIAAITMDAIQNPPEGVLPFRFTQRPFDCLKLLEVVQNGNPLLIEKLPDDMTIFKAGMAKLYTQHVASLGKKD